MERRKFRHITYEQRQRVQELLDAGHSVTEISQMLGFNYTSIDREIKRGSVDGRYDADYSEKKYRQHLSVKGPETMLTPESELSKYISKLILDEHLSLLQIINLLQHEGNFEKYPKSKTTLYAAIDNGLIPSVDRSSLKSDETTVFNDGTIHLAKWVRQELSIKDGDVLSFDVVDGKIVFMKAESVLEK